MMSAIEQGVLKALGGWVAHAGIAQGSEKAWQEKQLFEHMGAMRRPAPQEG